MDPREFYAEHDFEPPERFDWLVEGSEPYSECAWVHEEYLGHPSTWPVVDDTVHSGRPWAPETPELEVGGGPHLVRFVPGEVETPDLTSVQILSALIPVKLAPFLQDGEGMLYAVVSEIVPVLDSEEEWELHLVEHRTMGLDNAVRWLTRTARFGNLYTHISTQVLRCLTPFFLEMFDRAAPEYPHIPDGEFAECLEERGFYEEVVETSHVVGQGLLRRYLEQGSEADQKRQREEFMERGGSESYIADVLAIESTEPSPIWVPRAGAGLESDAPNPGLPTFVVPPTHWSPSRGEVGGIIFQSPFARLNQEAMVTMKAGPLQSWDGFFRRDEELAELDTVRANVYNDRVRISFPTQPPTILDFLSMDPQDDGWQRSFEDAGIIRIAWLPPHFDLSARTDPDPDRFQTEIELAVLREEVLAGFARLTSTPRE